MTVAANSSSATFTVSTTAVTSTQTATIAATAGAVTKTAVLTVNPPLPPSAVEGLSAAAGNQCVTLVWTEQPEETTRGYNVYRRSGGTTTRLTASPWRASIYGDTGLTNGSSYEYQVSVVNTQGQEVEFSPWVGAMPSSAVPSMSWVNPPATVSGDALLYAALSSGKVPNNAALLVDGKELGSVSFGAVNSSTSGKTVASLDTLQMPNGSHIVQLVGFTDGENGCATLPLTLQSSNTISNVAYDQLFDLDAGETMRLQATVPAETSQWTVDIVRNPDDNPIVIRSYQGTTSSVQVAWDGRDASGNTVEDSTTYALKISGTGGGASQGPVLYDDGPGYRWFVTPHRGFPSGLALIDQASKDTDASGKMVTINDRRLANVVKTNFARMKANYPSFNYVVLYASKPTDQKTRAKLLNWMRYNVTNFYIFSHGAYPGKINGAMSPWGGIQFFSYVNPTSRAVPRTRGSSPKVFDVPKVTNGRQYNFAWVDSCVSAGGSPPPSIDPGTQDLAWSKAFNIGDNQEYFSAFFGWNGFMGLNNALDGNGNADGTPSDWYYWRLNMWRALADGYFVSQAINRANNQTTRVNQTLWTTDQGRVVLDGDTAIP